MSKALLGYVGPPPAHVLMRELDALKARVAELERVLADRPAPVEELALTKLSSVPDNEAVLA